MTVFFGQSAINSHKQLSIPAARTLSCSRTQKAFEQYRSIKIDCGVDKTKAMAPLAVNGTEWIKVTPSKIHPMPLTGSRAIALVLSTPQSILIDLCCSEAF